MTSTAKSRPSPVWTWYRAKVRNPNRNPGKGDDDLVAEWEEISGSGAGMATYTPQGVDNDQDPPTGTATDEGWHLLARVVYGDAAAAAGNVAIGISAHPVRADVSNVANNSPDFAEGEASRSVPEDTAVGMPVGEPVEVTTEEDGDVLTYELDNDAAEDNDVPDSGTDVDFFSIDQATGQIKVKKGLSAEGTDDRDYDETDVPGTYVVWVRAWDSSGEGDGEDRDEIEVTITATDVNEAPGVTGMAELLVSEADSSDSNSYMGLGLGLADDGTTVEPNDTNLYKRDEEDVIDRAQWDDSPVPGVDGDLFQYSTPADGIGRRLHFKSPPDFENPMDDNRDNVYEVTITVEDSEGLMGMKDVRITVNNVNEAGKLVLSPEQPDSGMPLIATVEDPDGVVTITNWKWAKSADSMVADFAAAMGTDDVDEDEIEDGIIQEATTDRWTGEVGDFLWAMVEYRDGHNDDDDPVTATDERNYGARRRPPQPRWRR